MEAKRYNNIKLAISIGKGIVTFAMIFLFVYTGLSKSLVEYLRSYSSNPYVVFLLFVLVTSFVLAVIFWPLSFYSEFYLEHKYRLSNQTFLQWIWEDLKGVLVGGVIGIPVMLIFYYAIRTYGNLWWLVFAIIMFLLSVVLAKFLPVIILPLFYKVKPIENEELKNRVLKLAEKAGMKVENIFQFNMSKNTKKANAMFTGLGKTKKIILGDTLLNEYTTDEIETVIAHEMGHYKHKHIIKNLFIGTVSSFLMFFLIAYFYQISLSWFSFSNISQIAALPVLSLWAMIVGFLMEPLTNIISRKFEYQADEYAVKSTNKKQIFINTLNKLTEQNLSDKDPHPLIEWLFYSHPSIKNRVAHIESL